MLNTLNLPGATKGQNVKAFRYRQKNRATEVTLLLLFFNFFLANVLC
ncbi:hypothetical protein VCR4J2_250273 [Vibrio coralliirubri]|nr:hypothetical protein VCR4J2_250273 [Vibrio coralliirubri]